MRDCSSIRWLAVFSAALAPLFASSEAAAFCRSRTCEQSQRCAADDSGCIIQGFELHRTSSCVSYTVQEDASSKNGIDAETMDELVGEAFDRWTSADCGGGETPSIEVESFGVIECDRVEYNQHQGNSNVVLFHNDEWPPELDSRAFALTTVSFETTTGEIYDADMEINAAISEPLTFSNPEDGVDLPSILTHEVGHFLGLAHSLAPGAVMRPAYAPMMDDLRNLGDDDVEGICTIYPPDRETQSNSCTPRHGFASNCALPGGDLYAGGGCALAAPSRSGGASAVLLSAALLAALSRRRRRAQPTAGG